MLLLPTRQRRQAKRDRPMVHQYHSGRIRVSTGFRAPGVGGLVRMGNGMARLLEKAEWITAKPISE